MLTSTKVAISALLLAFSATGALAQSHIGDGRSATARQAKAYCAVPHHKRASADSCGSQPYANEVPWAPF
jgi:hypothetical protein